MYFTAPLACCKWTCWGFRRYHSIYTWHRHRG